MAERVILVDDLDEETSDGVERIEFTWRGTDYEVDLSPEHAVAGTAPRAPMPVADSKRARQTYVFWRPLKEETEKALLEQGACYVSLALTTGELSVTTDESADGLPWSIAAGWTLRWSIAPLPADRANKLLDEITPHAQRLIDATSTELPDRKRPGTVLYYGAGPALDAIQRRCAATWTDPDRLHTDKQ